MTNRQELRPAFFYGRVSTDGQDRELSIGEQKQHANEQAPREGYRFIQEFEEVKSAATDKRPAFLEMVSLAISPNRPAEAIFFNDLSRAFRNDEDFYMYRRMLREANVKIFTYEEGELKNDDQSQLMFGFKSLLNSQVPRKTARETRRGQFGATRRGFYLGLGVFGYEKYKVMDGGVEHIKLRPHPTQWEHLLSMFRMALENHGGRRIADHLNSLGVKTRLGNDWNESTVLGVLRNPACRGKTHRGENSRSPYLDRSEQVFCENAHEAAVSEEDYQTIERLIKLRTTAPGGPRAHSSPNPLSDHVKCGLCGSNMTLNRIKGITNLVCSNKRKNGKRACPAKNTRLDILMPRVVAALLERILTEETLRQQVALVAETNREFLVEQQTARETIEKNIAGTKKQISNLVDAIEGRGGNPQIYERLDDRESELKQLTVQLEGLNEKLTGHLEFLNAPDRIVSCALDLRTYIESEDPEVARMFILSFVKRVEVLGTEAIIHYKMPLPQDVTGGTKTADTVKIAKNGDRQESWLSPTPAGIGKGVAGPGGSRDPPVGEDGVAHTFGVGNARRVHSEGLTHPGRSRDGRSALGRSVGRGLGRHRLRAVAGPGLLVPRVVGEAHPHLDDQALILGGYPVAGAGPSLDVGSAGDPLVGEDGVLQAVRVVYFRSVGGEGLAHPGRSPDHR